MSMGTPLFYFKIEVINDKYSVDKVWTKIYCHFYFRGITLSWAIPGLRSTVEYKVFSPETVFWKHERSTDISEHLQNCMYFQITENSSHW